MDPIQARNAGHFSVVWGGRTRNRGGINGLGVIRFVSNSLFLGGILPPPTSHFFFRISFDTERIRGLLEHRSSSFDAPVLCFGTVDPFVYLSVARLPLLDIPLHVELQSRKRTQELEYPLACFCFCPPLSSFVGTICRFIYECSLVVFTS